ncbi:hypothetical protein [Bellilinea sp.]|uniref:hypothetical protein n=1 Tax=Bellilinea sp. TaxID=2838785 RepID=UPI0021DD0972|nr:hypothetical protein [Bellilinea sp.]GIV64809.1 MAG: hypothetical protein KatS3mg046_069 [Bellilinea sp.]
MSEQDELELIRMTRTQVLHARTDSSGLQERKRILAEKVLPPETLKRLILMAIGSGWVHNGRIRWGMLLPHLPVQPHGVEAWEVRYVALDLRPWELQHEFESAAWWWRMYLLQGIADPTAWVVEQAEKHEPGWVERIGEIAYGKAPGRGKVYMLVRNCRRALQLRQEYLAYLRGER